MKLKCKVQYEQSNCNRAHKVINAPKPCNTTYSDPNFVHAACYDMNTTVVNNNSKGQQLLLDYTAMMVHFTLLKMLRRI